MKEEVDHYIESESREEIYRLRVRRTNKKMAVSNEDVQRIGKCRRVYVI